MPLHDDHVARTFGSLRPDELQGLDEAINRLNRLVDQSEKKAGVRNVQIPSAKSRKHG